MPKTFNFKSPIYVDASSFLAKEAIPNFGSKIGDNAVILTKEGEDLRTFYPINLNPETLFRSIFNKNSLSIINQMNFLAKNYRPKCDICSNLCDLDWFMQRGDLNINKDTLLICDRCYENDLFPKNLTKESFELANFFNVINPSESKININNTIENYTKLKDRLENEKWKVDETIKLIDALERYGDNWDDIIKVNLSYNI